MTRLITLLLASLFMVSALAACGEEGPGKSGESCSNTGAYACFDNIVHLCRRRAPTGRRRRPGAEGAIRNPPPG